MIDEKREYLRALDALEANAVWRDVIAPKIAERAAFAAGKHEDAGLSAEKRAEWLHAMKELRELNKLVAEERRKTEEFLKKNRERAA